MIDKEEIEFILQKREVLKIDTEKCEAFLVSL